MEAWQARSTGTFHIPLPNFQTLCDSAGAVSHSHVSQDSAA